MKLESLPTLPSRRNILGAICLLGGAASSVPTISAQSDKDGDSGNTAGTAGGGETLRYAINWPSGLSLGECVFEATPFHGERQFTLRLEAAVPGFAILEQVTSKATLNHCSLRYEKKSSRGKKVADESTRFDAAKAVAIRTTRNGGSTTIPASPCPHDAVTYLYYMRTELAQGRLPAPEQVFYGAPYHVRWTVAGVERVATPEGFIDADRLQGAVKGPASEFTLEILLARDAVRTPLRVRVPLPLGRFSLELIR